MADTLAARRHMTGLIRENSPDGITEEELVSRLRDAGYKVSRPEVHQWIGGLRSAYLALFIGSGRWRIATDEERAGVAAAERAATGKWDYEFTAHAGSVHVKAVRDLFAGMITRQVMTFTPEEFASFRAELAGSGITLHEVTRVPHYEPETVG